jgi:H+/Cl- antiporter ClcA
MSSLAAAWRGHASSLRKHLARRVGSMSYLRRWLLLGTLLGIVAGLGAIVFYAALSLATHLLLGELAGYKVPTPFAEGNNLRSQVGHSWLLPAIVAVGGLVSGVLVFTFAPEAEGHGTDAAISAVHHDPRSVRVHTVLVKIIASAVTIGSGGSGGREGPTAQISAGFGSLLARVLDLSPEDGRIAVSVGIGSGIGSIFGAPLGGALLAAELLYRDDMDISALVPGFIASIVGYTVFSAVYGFTPLFGFAASSYHFHEPIQLAWFALIGVICGGVGLLYAKCFYGGVDLFARLPVSRFLKPAIGGLAVGLIALVMPQVLGHRLRLDTARPQPLAAVDPALDRAGTPARQDARDNALDRLRRLRRHLRPRHGHRRVHRSRCLAAARPDRPRHPPRPRRVRDRRNDGVLRLDRQSTARDDADGQRDDRQLRGARASDGRGRHRDVDRRALRRHHLPQPTTPPRRTRRQRRASATARLTPLGSQPAERR